MDSHRLQKIKNLRDKRKIVIPRPKDGSQGEMGLPGLPGSQGVKGDRGEKGAIGNRGSQGLPGIQGEKGATGPKGLVWRDEWKVNTKYQADDGVSLFGSAFICTTDHTSALINKPMTGGKWNDTWAILAERGIQGPGGAPGLQGIQGVPGSDGVGVPAGGTTGQVLAKASNTDFDDHWVDQTGGGGGSVTSVTAGDSTITVGGTATDPTVAVNAIAESKVTNLTTDLAGKEPSITSGTTAKYWRGDKSFQTLDTSVVPDTTNKRYVTDAQSTVIGNTSGTNTGDQDLSGLVPNTRTVNGHALSSNVTVSKSDISLGNVDNTSDANKPVSTAQQTALDLKANLASPTFTGTVSGITKTMVGLGNVDNTSDVNKPISTATQSALDAKQPLDSDLTTIAGLTATTDNFMVANASAWASRTPTQAKTSLALTKSDVGLSSVDNTSDTSKPVSTAQQTAIDAKVENSITTGHTTVAPSGDSVFTALALKAPLASPALTGSPTAPTQTPSDGSTKIATTQYVDTAVLQSPAKEAVKYASIAALPSIVYANGSSGVGATLTGVALAAISLDSSSPAVGNRVLIKDQASTFQNGIYTVTATGSGIAVFVLTRTADFDQATDIKTGDSVYVTNGSTLAGTTWDTNSADNPVMGTDPVTFAQTAGPGSVTGGNGITVTGSSIAINTSVTVDKTTAQALTNKDLTGAGNTFPTFNQDTSGSAAKFTTARNIDGQAFDGTTDITVIAPGTHATTSKATPVDADEIPLVDSVASNVLKKLTWANLKATLKSYFDTLYTTISAAVGGDLTGTLPNPTIKSGVSLSGNPTTTTQSQADNSTKIATTAYVDTGLGTKQATGSYITALTGDITASGPGSSATTLATVNSNTGSFGTATNVGQFTLNGKGLTIAAANVPIQITESQVTNLVADLAASSQYTPQRPASGFTVQTNTQILFGVDIDLQAANGDLTVNGILQGVH